MWVVRATLAVLVIVAVVAFAIYNIDKGNEVDVNLVYVTYYGVPMVIVSFWAFASGMFVSLLLFVSVYIRQSVNLRSFRHRVRALEEEVTVLRNRPIEESADLLMDNGKRANDIESPFGAGE